MAVAENRFLDVKKEHRIKFEDFSKDYITCYAKPNKKSWERDVDSLKHLKKHFPGKYIAEISVEV